MKKRIWLDTLVLTCVSKEQLENLITEGHTLVIANTALDVAVFQENIGWFEDQLDNGTIVIEIWNTPDEMTSRPFFWSSCQQETQTAASLAEAVAELPNAEEVLALAELVGFYGIPKGGWQMGPWVPPAPLTENACKILGINAGATRTAVLSAAKIANRMDLFDEFNIGYTRGLAIQHCCDAILNSDGTFTEI